jgi:hypothetical protein
MIAIEKIIIYSALAILFILTIVAIIILASSDKKTILTQKSTEIEQSSERNATLLNSDIAKLTKDINDLKSKNALQITQFSKNITDLQTIFQMLCDFDQTSPGGMIVVEDLRIANPTNYQTTMRKLNTLSNSSMALYSLLGPLVLDITAKNTEITEYYANKALDLSNRILKIQRDLILFNKVPLASSCIS